MDTLQVLAQRLEKPVSYFLEEEQLWEEKDHLLKALQCLQQAEQVLKEGRLPYAAALLEECGAEGAQTPYFLPVLERWRLVLLAKARPEAAEEILTALPAQDEELLLRAQVALHQQESAQAAAFLDAAQDQDAPEWCMLRGQAAFWQADYQKAAEYFHRAERAGEPQTYSWLEKCYQRLEDYKQAYYYACKQKH